METRCEDRARNLLAAWNGGHAGELFVVHDGAGVRHPVSADEQEREELLAGIRTGLLAGGTRSAVSLRLLRHLAAVH